MPGCKPGDMAKIKEPGNPNDGKLVVIRRELTAEEYRTIPRGWDTLKGPWFDVQPLEPLVAICPGRKPGVWANDPVLYPIRPGDLDHVDWRDKRISPEKELEREQDKWAREIEGEWHHSPFGPMRLR